MVKLLISPLFVFGLTEQLIKASSIQEIEKRKQSHLEKSTLTHLCQKQLEKNKIPISCYRITPLSRDLKKYLDKQCTKAPLESIKLHEISHFLKNEAISPQCLKVLEEKEKILKYQQQNSPLKDLLKRNSL